GSTKVYKNKDGSYFIDAWDLDELGKQTSTQTWFKPLPGNEFEVITQTLHPNGKITSTKSTSKSPPVSRGLIQEQNAQKLRTEKLIQSLETKLLTQFGLAEEEFQRNKKSLMDRKDLKDPIQLTEAAIAVSISEIPVPKLKSFVEEAMKTVNISPEKTRKLLRGEENYEDTLFCVEQIRLVEICSALKVLKRIGLEEKSKQLLEQLLP
ncbi:MAG: hypothetical protein ACKOA8_20435, partial [Deltaproteobacteria bacterium]